GVSNGRNRMTEKQARLKRESHHLGDAPSLRLRLRRSGETPAQILGESVQTPIRTAGLSQLIEKHPDRFRLALYGAKHVQTDHVACALPNAVERRLTVEAGHQVVFDEPIAAVTFKRLDHELWCPLAGPILGDRRRDAGQKRLGAITTFAGVERRRE